MTKFVKSLSALVFCTALLGLSSTAQAVMFMQLGDIEQTGSWTLPANMASSVPFDAMEVLLIPPVGGGGPLEAPPFINSLGQSLFNNATWSGTLVNPNYASATGASVTSLRFSINFAGDLRDPTLPLSNSNPPQAVTFDELFYSGGLTGTLLGGFRMSFDGITRDPSFFFFDVVPAGTVYDRVDPPADPVDPPGDPVPDTGSTLALLGMGMVGLGGLRRKLRLS